MQIEKLRERFISEQISAVYSSDLSRALVTAEALSQPRGLNIIKTQQLREVCMGVWEDLPWGEIEHRDSEMNRNFGFDPARWFIEGSERFTHVQERMTGCISDIAGRHDGETVAVFSHGFAIRAFMCKTMGVQSHEVVNVPYCDNTAVALLLFRNGELTIEYQGDNSHLSSELSTFAHQTWWRSEKEWKRENLRFELFDQERDKELKDLCVSELAAYSKESKEYTAIIGAEPGGLISLDTAAGKIDCVYIRPEQRGRGYGVQLIGQAVTECRKLRIEILSAEAPSNSNAVGFFHKYGFNVISDNDSVCVLEKNIRNW